MLEPGTLLQNRYRVTRQIGRGGMGAVYVATDERFNSTVAIKQTFFFDDPSLRRAFEREAILLNHLRHPALPRVSDHFVEDDGQFLVMEYIEGADLGELLKARGGWFPIADVLAWADELLDALEYLHAQEPPVVHRDIKPQNIKRTERGRMVLLDFGLAKGNPTRASATATGSLLGYSPHYAPLEQVQGTGTDTCSDIYSLGATLYHLLTGEPPVDALTRAGSVVNNEADPLRPAHVVRPEIPIAVSKVIRRAMAQKATLRPKTAAEMREMLRQTANGDATVLDAPTMAAGPSHYFGETTLTAVRPSARPFSTTNVSPHFDAEPERRSFSSKAKLLVAAAVVVVCVMASFPLMRRASAPDGARTAAPNSTTQAEESSAGAQQSDNEGASVGTPTAAATTPTPTPSNATEVSEPQTDPNAGAASAVGGANNAGATDNSKPAAPTENKAPIIIVVNPTPAPTAEPTESDETARRAEEARRSEEARRAEESRRAEDERRAEEARRVEELRRAEDELRRMQSGAPPPFGGQPPPFRGGPPPPPPGRPPQF